MSIGYQIKDCAGIVESTEEYVYSSARNYADSESVIDIIQVNRRWKTY